MHISRKSFKIARTNEKIQILDFLHKTYAIDAIKTSKTEQKTSFYVRNGRIWQRFLKLLERKQPE